MTSPSSQSAAADPELSLVIPCYNEEACLPLTLPPLVDAFRHAGVPLELVLVDNGSHDATSAVIDDLISKGLPVVKGTVPDNQGQGLGFLTGIRLARGRFIGWICADGQVRSEDVLAIFESLRDAPAPAMAKARRRYRQDSWLRKINSIVYNALFQVLFLGIRSLDINGNPKIFPADVLRQMELQSIDWFLEAEAMLKADYLRLPIIEMDVIGLSRADGHSHVRLSAVLEFIKNMLVYRLGTPWRTWRLTASQHRSNTQ